MGSCQQKFGHVFIQIELLGHLGQTSVACIETGLLNP